MNRSITSTPFATRPVRITEDLLCDSTFTWTFTIEDTSFCGSSMWARVIGPQAGSFTVTPRNLDLVQGEPQTISVTFNGTSVGTFTNTLQVIPRDRCGYVLAVPITIDRITELSVDRDSIAFDTLLVGCRDVEYHDSTLTLCNTTDQLGAPRVVTVFDITSNDPTAFRVVNATFPLQLAPGQCTTLVVRSFVQDTTNDYFDTLQVISDDRCQSRPAVIPVSGRTQEVISIRSTKQAASCSS